MNFNLSKASALFPLFIFMASLIFLGRHFDEIKNTYYDEFHYVPAAKEWISMSPTRNLEHPPLGKYLIAAGIEIFGDNSTGFRSMSLLSGSLTLVGIYLISLLLFENISLSLLITLYSYFNFWIFVQSRIAMLDLFMICFNVFAIFYYLKYQKTNKLKNYYFSSALWGLSIAIKWSALFLYLGFLIIVVFGHFLNFIKEVNLSPDANKLINQNLKGLIKFFVFSVFIYYLTFIPYMFVSTQYHFSLFEIIFKLPFRMLKLQLSVPAVHSYKSSWYTWPLMIRPIWYVFQKIPSSPGSIYAIILLGNPFQMAVGLLAVISSVIFYFTSWFFDLKQLRPSKTVASITCLFLVSWLMWAISSRGLTFFYYFLPSAICYSFLVPAFLLSFMDMKKAIVIMAFFVVISSLFFFYFYPIISGTPIESREFLKWMWLRSWI